MTENNSKLTIKSIEKSNLFQRRLHHGESHNYDNIGGHDEDVQLKNHKSNTNTLKSADNNDNFMKLNNSKTQGGGSEKKMDSQMGKSVKFEINKGSVCN